MKNSVSVHKMTRVYRGHAPQLTKPRTFKIEVHNNNSKGKTNFSLLRKLFFNMQFYQLQLTSLNCNDQEDDRTPTNLAPAITIFL